MAKWSKELVVAYELAKNAHAGQKRRGTGEDYFNHPIRVSQAMKTINETITALLHDVLEDTDIVESDLWKAKIPVAVIKAVQVLTKDPDKPYDGYLSRIMLNPLARVVKIADMLDNLTDLPTTEQVAKYKRGILFLMRVR
ncbi:GTP pyrophosphokinase [Candidatus Bathyarchaeota archaeon]|nr:MAG: GTP pyrophosphokinase [Candidatus Bathyarchaeota archaeon]